MLLLLPKIKKFSKYQKLPKENCRATCGKRYITSINKTMTKESKQTKIKTFVLVVDLKVLNGSTKSRFKFFFWNFLFDEELTVSFNRFVILLGCRST